MGPSSLYLTADKGQPHAKLITFVEGSVEVTSKVAPDQEWFPGQCRGQALHAAMRGMEEQGLASVFGTFHDGEYWRNKSEVFQGQGQGQGLPFFIIWSGNVRVSAAAAVRRLGPSTRSLVTTIGDGSSALSKKWARTASVALTPVITNIKLQSLTVIALRAHEQPPGPMQT